MALQVLPLGWQRISLPHNLGEVIDGCLAYVDNEDITID